MVSEAKEAAILSEVKAKPLEEMSTLMDVDPFPRSRPLSFTSEFDSGNFLSVELVHTPDGLLPDPYQLQNDYEVNIRTKPDCHGSHYANGNRTWFYFGICGGRPSAMIKINILNLNKQLKLYEQGMQPVFRCLPEKPNWERIRDRVVLIGQSPNDCSISFRHKLPETSGTSTLYFAFTYPYSYSEMLIFLDNLDTFNRQDRFQTAAAPLPSKNELALTRSAIQNIQNEIYYVRECVCHSLDGRRLELITVTSLFGSSKEREDYLINLFPYRETEKRPFKFPNKKIVFLSARVHPGETCSQFVLNGFLKFILEPKDPRAIILRRLFVFKLIPILNPDGVARGHYRTDPRGVNLNRVYLQPSPILHPTIYAARKLILYAHYGFDTVDDYDYELDTDSKPTYESLIENEKNSGASAAAADVSEAGSSAEKPFGPSSDTNESTDSKPTSEDVVMKDQNMNMQVENLESVGTFDSCDEDSVDPNTSDVQGLAFCDETSGSSTPGPSSERASPSTSKPKLPKIMERERSRKVIKLKKVVQTKSQARTTVKDTNSLEKATEKKSSKKSKSQSQNERKSKSNLSMRSSTKLRSAISHQSSMDSQSGIFMYIDMHGHATKRGIFMYGNHFSDAEVQAECMLFPRLMALNCQDFDFAACNFTERLMGLKDKRDGASREGSGRVAVLKLTGLIRSYTLECNYNTGRIVNHLPSRPVSFGFSDPTPHSTVHPPKYTPAIFETTGQAIAESILDLTGHNPWSRLNYTEFRSLDGMRRALHRRLINSVEFRVKEPSLISLRKSVSFPGTAAPTPSNITFGSKGMIPGRKRSISNVKSHFMPTVTSFGPKKEIPTSSAQSKAGGSKVKAPRQSSLFEKSTFSAPTASSKAKLVPGVTLKAPISTTVPKSKKSDLTFSTVPPGAVAAGHSKSLSKIFKSKKKVQKKLSKKKNSDIKPSSA